MNMKQKDIISKINSIANMIHTKSMRGSSNYIIVSAEISEKIKEIDMKYLRNKKLKEIENNS